MLEDRLEEFTRLNPVVATLASGLVIGFVAVVAYVLTKRVLLASLKTAARKTTTKLDDFLLEEDVFGRLAYFAPALVFFFGFRAIPGLPDTIEDRIERFVASLMVLFAVSAFRRFLNAGSRAYADSEFAVGRPIEAYVQVTKILSYIVGGLLAYAVLTGRDIWPMLTGLGAATAVLLLVFRDTILSFVASLQMASYDLVRVGDWIEMSKYGADGDVIDISLHTVKVQNWDKTITAIPTAKLIEEPFRNWRGMTEAGGRRIKRSFFVDMASIRFLTEEEVDRLENFVPLREYIRAKREEIKVHNEKFSSEPNLIVNARRLTNVGTLRAYLVGYLKRHPKVHQDMTLIVRQLAPTPEGLPIELYLFTNTTAWSEYENIQSDVFDHIFSIVPEFGVKVFQAPSGADFARLASS